jgi:hypothetical protein
MQFVIVLDSKVPYRGNDGVGSPLWTRIGYLHRVDSKTFIIARAKLCRLQPTWLTLIDV